jgi:NADPH:quinone reductase-like Zn-dependent oxidoreductase
VDVHLDTAGRHDLDAALTVVGGAGDRTDGGAVRPAGTARRRGLHRGGHHRGLRDQQRTHRRPRRAATAVSRGLAAERFAVRIAAELPLSQTAQAHRMLEAGGVRGRIVLRPDGP